MPEKSFSEQSNSSTRMPIKCWKKSFSAAIKSSQELGSFLQESIEEISYPLLIPVDFAQRIKDQGPHGPLWKQFVPSSKEDSELGFTDPIGDHLHGQDGGIIHRYKNRILFSPTEVCPIQCRYCFRKNELHTNDPLFKPNTEHLKDYLERNPQVEEVILTGGDPLILSDQKLHSLLRDISSVPSVEMIRFHSRTPIILPERLTKEFLKVLESFSAHFKSITIVIHCNHSSELSEELAMRIRPYHSAGVHFLSQSVLLRGVNDEPIELAGLFKDLYHMGIKPYYLHHPDPVKGAMHFRLPLEEGQEIYRKLRSLISGVMLPHYMIELPNGRGKAIASAQRDSQNRWYDKDGKRLKDKAIP